ncbi:hypothetical protein H6G97_40720 [Nostoc flagelliforme FACHB-838]|uniref:Uncharacterized protein n=1 Tax=Nostoc flagelliforme FACHB-838 TaxID=2692904 RepID=A0ABR8E2A4_9NOSO|nr:hypothetical protein [Nostoc flagelliforme]MBD2535385.1 hypothetical protein [Nostoc flagelliforme FACHB-838]
MCRKFYFKDGVHRSKKATKPNFDLRFTANTSFITPTAHISKTFGDTCENRLEDDKQRPVRAMSMTGCPVSLLHFSIPRFPYLAPITSNHI